TLPAVAADLVWPRGWEWLILLGVGVFTQLGQVYLTYGMRHEPAGRAAALSYLQVVFAAVWGAAFFGDVPGYWTAAGAALILTGAYVNVRHRSSPKPAV
ncbi:MAG TPA: DMT family transporter, partial [Gemmataceae bacterium]